MNFKEDTIEHNIIRGMSDKEFFGYDEMIKLPDDDKFIQDTLNIIYKKDKEGKNTKEIESKVFHIREQKTWWGFPLYQFKDGKIEPFDYTKYIYFANTNRRMALASKINNLYNPSSELKIQRKTLKYIMDTLEITYPDLFENYNNKIEAIINKNPKN